MHFAVVLPAMCVQCAVVADVVVVASTLFQFPLFPVAVVVVVVVSRFPCRRIWCPQQRMLMMPFRCISKCFTFGQSFCNFCICI